MPARAQPAVPAISYPHGIGSAQPGKGQRLQAECRIRATILPDQTNPGYPMRQPSLSGPDENLSRVVQAVDPVASARHASPEQKKFRKLISRIEAVRADLVQWRSFLDEHERKYAEQAAPLFALYREKRIAMAHLLDRHMANPQLKKTHRVKVSDLLVGMLSGLIAEEHDDDLVRLYDTYSHTSFSEELAEEEEFIKSVAEDMFGIDMTDVPLDSPEAIAEAIEAQFAQAAADRENSARQRKKSAKALADEARIAEIEEGATKSLRAVFRKLASALHPDRELDPAERARKTALMQEVNRAYDARDLLALLELQLKIEQIDPAALADLTRERLVHYNRVLQDQLLTLEEELRDLTMPIVLTLGGGTPRHLTPAFVVRAFNAHLAEIRQRLGTLEDDLVRYQDVRLLKEALRNSRSAQTAEELEFIEEVLAATRSRGRGRRR